MKHLNAANDNNPQRATRDSERPIACPTLARFIKNEDAAKIRALMDWRDLTRPRDPFNPESIPGYLVGTRMSAMRPERQMNKLFSPRELKYLEAAANDNNGIPTFDEHGQAHLGGLTFKDGKCITPGVFNDENEFGKVRTSSSPNGGDVFGEEKHGTAMETELVRTHEERYYRQCLGPYANILDLACGDNTAEQIGRIDGESQSTAERHGKRLIDDAIELFIQLNQEKFEKVA